MSKIDKLLKAASKVTVEPQDNLDEKIIEKIKNLNEEDVYKRQICGWLFRLDI